MMTRKQIREAFALGPIGGPALEAFGPEGVDAADIVNRLFSLQLAGRSHGLQGWYPDGDFSSDADWVYGPGAEIAKLSELLEIDDDSVGQLYSDMHAHYFRDGTINPGERDWKPDIFDLSFGAHGDTHISVHAKGAEDALEQAADHLADIAPGLFVEPEYAETTCEIGLLLCWPDGLTEDEQEDISAAAEADLTQTEAGWLANCEWTIDGPR